MLEKNTKINTQSKNRIYFWIIRWFTTKLFLEYNGVEDEEELKKLHREWAPKSLDFVLDLGPVSM